MNTDKKEVEQCLSCKLISVGCLFGIGSYLIHISRLQKGSKSKYSMFLLGAGSLGLGVGEIFDKSPFRDATKMIDN